MSVEETPSWDRDQSRSIDLPIARRYFVGTFNALWEQQYFAESFGYDCIRDGHRPGIAGTDIEALTLVEAQAAIWPPSLRSETWTLEILLEAVRFYFQYVSKPMEFEDHLALGCGRHARTFDRDSGRGEYVTRVNRLLGRLDPPVEIGADGTIALLSKPGLPLILEHRLGGDMGTRLMPLVSVAIEKFRRATDPSDQKDAVRDLADILEELRPSMEGLFSIEDEGALFNIANNFAIRHRNQRQRQDYDRSIWMPWIFFWYLAAIYSITEALDRRGSTE
jgi:hypothetical protein